MRLNSISVASSTSDWSGLKRPSPTNEIDVGFWAVPLKLKNGLRVSVNESSKLDRYEGWHVKAWQQSLWSVYASRGDLCITETCVLPPFNWFLSHSPHSASSLIGLISLSKRSFKSSSISNSCGSMPFGNASHPSCFAEKFGVSDWMVCKTYVSDVFWGVSNL